MIHSLLKRVVSIGLVGAAALAMAGTVAAADFKVGFINIDRIFQESNAAKASQTRLETEFSKRQKQIEELGASVQDASKKLERDAPTLSEAQRIQRQRDLVQMDQDFQRSRREFQEDLALRKNEELQKVLEMANKVVKDVAKSDNYDLILQDAVYMSPKHDITERVLRSLNAGK
jgi:outer membrane protein